MSKINDLIIREMEETNRSTEEIIEEGISNERNKKTQAGRN